MIHESNHAADARLALCSRTVAAAQPVAATVEDVLAGSFQSYPWIAQFVREDVIVPPISMRHRRTWLGTDLYERHLHDLRDELDRAQVLDVRGGSQPFSVTRFECIAALLFLEPLHIPWIDALVAVIPHDPLYLPQAHYAAIDPRVPALAKALRYLPPPTHVYITIHSRYHPAELRTVGPDPLAFVAQRLERMNEICDELDRGASPSAWRHDASNIVPSHLLRSQPHYHRYVERLHTWGQAGSFHDIEFKAAADFLIKHVLIANPEPTPVDADWHIPSGKEIDPVAFFQSTVNDTQAATEQRLIEGLRIIGDPRADAMQDPYPYGPSVRSLTNKLADLCRDPVF